MEKKYVQYYIAALSLVFKERKAAGKNLHLVKAKSILNTKFYIVEQLLIYKAKTKMTHLPYDTSLKKLFDHGRDFVKSSFKVY